jgi:hypothetical protein
MKTKISLLSIVLLSWASFAQACPCVDEETLTATLIAHQQSVAVETAVIGRLQNPDLIALVNSTILADQAKIQELQALSVNAGIPYKTGVISQGFQDRATQEIGVLASLTGTALDHAYLNFRAGELQRLLTAYDTYFVLQVETPTLKVWAPKERILVAKSYTATTSLQARLEPSLY